ncbi:MAG TPA: glycosyltransferase family 9 protein [Chloroflexia bacterium]|nr:glycosyltransferase family 9 protein [Chloroflexia bacterium]
MLPDTWKEVRRILVMRLDNIGDVVMIGPALRALKEALPQAHLTLMVSPAGSQIAPLLPWVDEIQVHRATWQDASGNLALDPARELALVEKLREGRYDAAIIFTSFSQSPYPPAYACYLAGIPVRLGQSKEFGGSILSQWVKPLPDGRHQVDRNLHLLEMAGFEEAGRHLELRIPEEVQAQADHILIENGLDPLSPFVVVAPGASCAARRYEPQRYAEVVRLLAERYGLAQVILGSERERELCEPILAAAPADKVLSLVGQTSVVEMTAINRRSALVIANDSGPMHLADAFLRPMVILFSGTEIEEQWRPRFAPARLLRRPTACSPCYGFRCPYNMECLDIEPEEVVDEALRLLERTSERIVTAG